MRLRWYRVADVDIREKQRFERANWECSRPVTMLMTLRRFVQLCPLYYHVWCHQSHSYFSKSAFKMTEMCVTLAIFHSSRTHWEVGGETRNRRTETKLLVNIVCCSQYYTPSLPLVPNTVISRSMWLSIPELWCSLRMRGAGLVLAVTYCWRPNPKVAVIQRKRLNRNDCYDPIWMVI